MFLTGFPIRGAGYISTPSQPLLQNIEILLFPEKLKSKPMPRSSPSFLIYPFGAQGSYMNGSLSLQLQAPAFCLPLSFPWAFGRPALPSPPTVSYSLLESWSTARPLQLVMWGLSLWSPRHPKCTAPPGLRNFPGPCICVLLSGQESGSSPGTLLCGSWMRRPISHCGRGACPPFGPALEVWAEKANATGRVWYPAGSCEHFLPHPNWQRGVRRWASSYKLTI